MIKKLLQKYQAYRDKKFLARLERVLNNNVVGANLFIEKNIFSLRGFHMYFPKGAVADGYYAKRLWNERLVDVITDGANETPIQIETLGQFTGLRDKNGIEIYEGDIIRWRRDGKLYLVKFYAGMFYASVEELNKGVYGGFPLHVLTVNEEDGYKCEVCGNIYDNSELLKGCSHE